MLYLCVCFHDLRQHRNAKHTSFDISLPPECSCTIHVRNMCNDYIITATIQLHVRSTNGAIGSLQPRNYVLPNIMAEYKLLRRSALLLVPVHVQFVCCTTCPYPVASKFDWLLCSNIAIHTDVIVITSCTYDVMLVTSSLRHHYIIITSSNPGPTRRHGGHAGAGW